jgi:hypothetical protein
MRRFGASIIAVEKHNGQYGNDCQSRQPPKDDFACFVHFCTLPGALQMFAPIL